MVGSEVSATQDDPGYRSYIDEEAGGRFVVTVDQYPSGIPTPQPTQTTYLLLLRAHAKDHQLNLVSTHGADLGGRPALEGLFVADGGRREVVRVLMVGPRIYQVECDETEQGGGGDAAAEGFLDSFRLR